MTSANSVETSGSATSPSPLVEPRQHTQEMLHLLATTRPWVRFLSVLGFIGLGILVLIALAIMVAGDAMREATGGVGGWVGIAYLVMAVVYLPPLVYLSRYADAIKEAVATQRTGAVEDALRHQRAFWRYWGISVLVLVGIYAIGIVLTVVFAVLQVSTRVF